MMDFDFVAEYDKVIQLFEQSCAEQLKAARLDPSSFPGAASEGLPDLSSMEAKFQEVRDQMMAKRTEIATAQQKLTQLEADSNAMTQRLDAMRQRSEAYHEAAKSGGFPPDAELESAPMLSNDAIHALIQRLLQVHQVVPRAPTDEGSVAAHWAEGEESQPATPAAEKAEVADEWPEELRTTSSSKKKPKKKPPKPASDDDSIGKSWADEGE